MVHSLHKIRRVTWIRLLMGIFILGGLFFLVPLTTLRDFLSFDHIVAWVKTAQSNTWTLAYFYIAFTLATLGFPITIFPIVGGVLFPFWIALPVNIAAATTGSMLAFGIARLFGREVVQLLFRGWGKSLDKLASNQGFKSVLAIRVVGIPPYILANYGFGLTGVRVRDYFWGTLFGITPWLVLMTYLAQTFWKAALVGGEKGLLKAVISAMMPLTILSLTLAAIALGFYFFKRKKNSALNHSNL